jgi:hypothetical protein
MATSTMQQLMESIYADTNVSPVEVMRLRKAVDEAEQQIMTMVGEHGIVAALLKSFDVTRQLLQDSVLEVRKSDKFTPEAKQQIYAAIAANVSLLQVNLDAFAK